MKRPREFLHDLCDSLTRTLGCGPWTADDHHLIGIPREAPQGRVALGPIPIPHLHVAVGSPGAADTPRRAPPRGGLPSTVLQHSDLQPWSPALQHPPVTNPTWDQAHQHLVVNGVNVGLDGGVHHRPAAHQVLFAPVDRLGRTALRSKALGVVLDVGREARLDHPRARVLDHAIPHRGTPQRPLAAVWLGNVPPQYRLRLVAPAFQVGRTGLKEAVPALARNILETTTIGARTPSMRADCLPGPPQQIGPDDAIVERMEPSVPAPVGRSLSPALEWS
jgi:hypothetical protein